MVQAIQDILLLFLNSCHLCKKVRIMNQRMIRKGHLKKIEHVRTTVVKSTTIVVLVIIVACVGSNVTPEFVNFKIHEHFQCLVYQKMIFSRCDLISMNSSNQKSSLTCLKARAMETAPLISPAHHIMICTISPVYRSAISVQFPRCHA